MEYILKSKAPWLHHQEGKDIALATLKVLKKYGYTQKGSLVYLQTFDFNELKRIKKKLLPRMGMDLKISTARCLFRLKRKKDAQGKWVNYEGYDWMF